MEYLSNHKHRIFHKHFLAHNISEEKKFPKSTYKFYVSNKIIVSKKILHLMEATDDSRKKLSLDFRSHLMNISTTHFFFPKNSGQDKIIVSENVYLASTLLFFSLIFPSIYSPHVQFIQGFKNKLEKN